MKIVLTSVGTRGDMEPFLAIGELLKEKGHRVICAFPEQFGELVHETGLEFASLGTKFMDLLDSQAGKDAMGGATGFKKIIGTIKLALHQNDANKELLYRQQEIIERENPDRILYNGKAVYPVIWKLKNKGKTIFISAIPYMHYVKGHTHVALNSNWGDFFNKLTFELAYFGMYITIKISRRWLKIRDNFSYKAILEILRYNKSIYTVSPSLFSRPDDWSENLKVLGYQQRSKIIDWQPDKSLSDFIAKHKKVLFITFGSMVNPDPEKLTGIILDILERHKIHAIINTAAGGLVKPEHYNTDLIYFVPQISYEWIFPNIYGIIHHGGAGTTHLALLHGCATAIIPHIIDQFIWNKIVYDKGAGPKGIKIGKINSQDLERMILDLLTNTAYKKKAEQISYQMKKEYFKDELYRTIME